MDEGGAALACVRGVTIQLLPRSTKILLQRFAVAEPTAHNADSMWGLPPNRSSGSEPVVLWRSPHERMVVAEAASFDAVLASIEPEIDCHVIDVSHALATLRLRGVGVPIALAAEIGVDLAEGRFSEGDCVRTQFAQVHVLLHRRCDERFTWDLHVDRSLVSYVRDWLIRCAGGRRE